MIRMRQFPPPAKYYPQVRVPGMSYLQINPNPSAAEFKRHAYWQKIHNDLYQLYNGICSYCALWTTRTVRADRNYTSVDHFIPKSFQPMLAYEWTNFRLCRARLNANKDNSLDVIDPFYVENGWFQIDFTTFLLVASS